MISNMYKKINKLTTIMQSLNYLPSISHNLIENKAQNCMSYCSTPHLPPPKKKGH